MKTIIKPQPTESNPVVVDNYPYGYKKTQCRFWIESVKNKGDRFVKQTLNPKTGEWNKPKKSTYSPIMVAFKDATGKTTYRGLSTYVGKEDYDKFADFIKTNEVELNDIQKDMLKYAYAFTKAHENVTYECKPVEYVNDRTGDVVTSMVLGTVETYTKVPTPERDKEQEQIKKKINNAIGYYYENAPVAGGTK